MRGYSGVGDKDRGLGPRPGGGSRVSWSGLGGGGGGDGASTSGFRGGDGGARGSRVGFNSGGVVSEGGGDRASTSGFRGGDGGARGSRVGFNSGGVVSEGGGDRASTSGFRGGDGGARGSRVGFNSGGVVSEGGGDRASSPGFRGGDGGARGSRVGFNSGGVVGGRGKGNYTNACLTMHQPWASLLVHGIKRVEGRSWPAPLTGRLWIHAASKIPDPETIKAMEDFYKEIYSVNGVTDIKFPEHYPISRLLGCIEVVGCVRSEELVSWEQVPESVRLEGLTEFCWLCENPQKLVVPFEMRGFQGVYNLEKKIYDAAVRGLRPIQGPLPVKFPLPDPRDPFSLKPGSLALHFSNNKAPASVKTPSVSAAIAGARAAATQFSKRDQSNLSN
ncbi:circumsporozoite protein-like isoform X1 [Zingiber officinale]|uniref:circumsporozoite protein-like isoform X1 n=1 Tax=Zingiber officinale TaxID=94328 RepID=UPI001C4B3015|nr:circumsporozoite protein-like isoform X1 [Zingiber officinale]